MKVKVPSYQGLQPASELASRVKKRNRRSNTKPELALRKAVWRHGLRYRTNVRDLPGNPDLVFSKAHIVVFCDGDFWHGRNWKSLRKKLSQGTNPDYWLKKIQANRTRDRLRTKSLQEMGWLVIRIWETDILRNTELIANMLARTVSFQTEIREKSQPGK